METRLEKKARTGVEASQAWKEYQARSKRIDDNMMRLRAERLARERSATLPETQGEKVKPKKPGRKSRNQNVADRP